ncbi:TRIC cation channel family protein [Serratia proteamaculans]|uniref:Glycine transporter domain-containing protein n=1 Tax=Serratia proteamaculans TaxID=28151 RepID=A0A5Q2V8I4_SERPR|nr:TRIC cation channel family protein [Serratia proteamaculans]QGH60556.1 hypothetical protein GHV41_06745 [Serratia proteamaculans]
MLVFWLDILGTAVFAISGVLLAGKLRMDPFGVLVLGVVTAVGGGIIRDVLAREIPMILRTEIYATACIIGGIVHATAYATFGMPLQQAMMLGMGITLAIRLAAIRWHLKLPAFILER